MQGCLPSPQLGSRLPPLMPLSVSAQMCLPAGSAPSQHRMLGVFTLRRRYTHDHCAKMCRAEMQTELGLFAGSFTCVQYGPGWPLSIKADMPMTAMLTAWGG